MEYEFVPKGFKAPYEAKADNFVIRKLTVAEVKKDYKAVMSSKESLRQIFCIDDDWPADSMTIEENYNDLLRHEEEFNNNEGFAYTIVNPDDSKCIGCLYIYPFAYGVYDSKVYYWLVDDINSKLNQTLRLFLDKWIPENFNLSNPIYPGRDLSHKEWFKLVKQIKKNNMD